MLREPQHPVGAPASGQLARGPLERVFDECLPAALVVNLREDALVPDLGRFSHQVAGSGGGRRYGKRLEKPLDGRARELLDETLLTLLGVWICGRLRFVSHGSLLVSAVSAVSAASAVSAEPRGHLARGQRRRAYSRSCGCAFRGRSHPGTVGRQLFLDTLD